MKFVSEDNGNCRVYFRTGSNHLYCFQEDTPGAFTLYACSRDGEPSHPSGLDMRPDPCPGETTTGQAFNTWLEKEP